MTQATRHVLLSASLISVIAGAAPGQQKRVYIANDDHTDFVWNCSERTNRDSFLAMLDYYTSRKDLYIGNPSDFQSRFNVDSAYMLRVYEEERTPAQFNRMIEAVRSGHISVPLTELVSCYGGTPAEAVLRGMYYAGSLERRYDLRFRLAVSMENQTQPWGLASLWAGSGAKYSWKGICGCVSRTPYAGQREHEVYWYTGPDGKRVLMKWYSAANSNPDSSIGGYAEARFVPAAVDYVTSNAPFNGFAARHPYPVIGVFGHGWDNNSSLTDEFITTAQSMSNASRRVIVSNELDYFADFETNHGTQLGSVNYSYGNEWELYQCSMAELTARVRRAVEGIRPAEAMAAQVALNTPAFMNGREAARTLFNLGLGMYWEHDWTGDGGFRAEKQLLQRRVASEIEAYQVSLLADARGTLGDQISTGSPAHGATRFFAFNPLSWTRTGAADFPYAGTEPLHVVDVRTGLETPSQVVVIGGQRFVRAWAEQVPSLGYAVFEVRPGVGAPFPAAATVTPEQGAPATQTVTYQVSADNRDAHSLRSGGPAYEVRLSGYNSGDRHDYVGTDGEQQTAAAAFAVNLPAHAHIVSAALVVRASPGSSASATGAMRIRMYDVDTTLPFQNGFVGDLVTHHPVAAASVLWPAPAWPGSSTITSPNIGGLVQAFVDRPGYTPGNFLGLVIDEGTLPADHYYGWDDFAKPGGTPAQLVVTYESGGSGPSGNLIVDNGDVALTVTPRGSVTSYVDHALNDRQFVQTIGGRAMNDLGGAALTGTLAVENTGPVSVTVRATSGERLAHETRVTLYRDGRRADFDNRITQGFDTVEDWAFSFNLPSPLVRYEEVGAIATAALRTAGGHLATQNARYDWLTLGHLADMQAGDGVGVTLGNIDVPFFRLGNSSVGSLDTSTPQLTPVAGGKLDGPGLGLDNQGGDTSFTQRFAVTTRNSYSASAAMRFALEHSNPLVTGLVTGVNAVLPEAEHSLLAIDNPNVLAWAVKPAEDDEGPAAGPLVLRMWNVSDAPAQAAISFPGYTVDSAAVATHVETPDATIGPAPSISGSTIAAAFERQEIRTLRVSLSPACASPCPSDVNCDLGVDGDDVIAFFAAWDAGRTVADFNGDGGVDGDDVIAFFAAWDAGC